MRALPTIGHATGLARQLLEPLGDRWAHVQAVAARAGELIAAVGSDEDRHLLVVAAWWHDLGYSDAVRDTGCHQIDGARFVERCGYAPRLAALVAHHSAATNEAEERGLLDDLMVWPREESDVSDALWTADMTTGPHGEPLSYDDRRAEILARYSPLSPVGRAMTRAEPSIAAAITRTRLRMQKAYPI